MREEAKPLDRAEREHRPQHRPGQPRDEAERREIAEDDVLEHVHELEVLLAERVDRGVERNHDQRDSEPEEELPPAVHRLAAVLQGPRAPVVEERGDDRRDELKRLDVPLGCDRGDWHRRTVWTMPPCTSSTTTS